MRASVTKRLEASLAAKKAHRAKYSLPQEAVDIGEGIADGILWQDARKREIFIYLHYEDLLLRELARRLDVQREELFLLTSYEVADVFSKKTELNSFDWRKEGMAFVIDPEGVMQIEDSEQAKEYWKTYVQKDIDLSVREFRGITASKGAGPVQGKVRIISDPRGVESLKSDEILVTTMTTPDYVFLMKKRQSDRHRHRRPYVARGHRLPRTRCPVHRGHEGSHARSQRW